MIYPFECKKCGHKEDIVLSIKDVIPSTIKCPECKGIMVRNLLEQFRSQNVKVPQHMMATPRYPTRINYSKDAAIENAD